MKAVGENLCHPFIAPLANLKIQEPLNRTDQSPINKRKQCNNSTNDAIGAIVFHTQRLQQNAAGEQAHQHGDGHAHVKGDGVLGYSTIINHPVGLILNVTRVTGTMVPVAIRITDRTHGVGAAHCRSSARAQA